MRPSDHRLSGARDIPIEGSEVGGGFLVLASCGFAQGGSGEAVDLAQNGAGEQMEQPDGRAPALPPAFAVDHVDHTRLEAYVLEHGREIERRSLQAHLELRAASERQVEVRGADGVRRTPQRQWARRLLDVGGLGGNLGRLKKVAEAKGVQAKAYFEEGADESIITLAKKHLGDANVHIFPR